MSTELAGGKNNLRRLEGEIANTESNIKRKEKEIAQDKEYLEKLRGMTSLDIQSLYKILTRINTATDEITLFGLKFIFKTKVEIKLPLVTTCTVVPGKIWLTHEQQDQIRKYLRDAFGISEVTFRKAEI